MQLWLARHARPLLQEGLCYGALDVSADEAETVAAAARLERVLPRGVDVLCSPLGRCVQLAKALRVLRPDLAPKLDGRLAEMDFGAWEGRAWNEIQRSEIDAWTQDFAHYRVGGTGERVIDFVARVDELLGQTRETRRDQAWIAHAGVYKVLLRRIEGLALDTAADWPTLTLDCGHWQVFQFE